MAIRFAVRSLSGPVLLILMLVQPVTAAVLLVPDNFPTIQAAIDAGAPGDTVQLAGGSYMGEGNRDLDFHGKDLLLRSASGNPGSCVLDCEGSEGDPHRAFHFHEGETSASRIEGITMRNGWAPLDHYVGGGGVFCESGSSPSFRNCEFSGNHGSAFFSIGGCNPRLEDCVFTDNYGRNGGGVAAKEGQFDILGCEFIGNEALFHGGGLHGHAGSFDIQDCLFDENRAPAAAAIDMIYGCNVVAVNCRVENNIALESFWSVTVNLHGVVDARFENCSFSGNESHGNGEVIVTSKSSHGTLRSCTFHDNRIGSGTVILLGESDGSVDNCIIADNGDARGLYIDQVISLTCTDIHGNGGGDWVDGMELWLGQDGNISADPLFCDPENGDLTLHANSPCADAQAGCGLMGAWPVNCGLTATRDTNWSTLKLLYGN